MDLPSFPELGVDGQHRKAVADPGAIAASLAHGLVDHHPAGRFFQDAPLSQPAGLGGAALVVDQHRHTRGPAQLLLHPHHVLARADADTGGEGGVASVASDVVGADGDGADALGGQRPGQGRNIHEAGHVLATGHGNRRVVEQLEGDMNAGGHAGPDGQAARVAERPVAQVLKQVPVAHKRSQPDPMGSFGSHRRGRYEGLVGVADFEMDHAMAAHAAPGDRTDRHHGGTVVGTAAAKGRRPGRKVRQGQDGLADGRGLRRCHVGQNSSEDGEHPLGCEFSRDRHQRLALAVPLGLHRREPPGFLQDGSHLLLDERPLLFNDQNLVHGIGQLHDPGRHERIGQGQLENPNTGTGQVVGSDPSRFQGAEHVTIGLAGTHNAEPGARFRSDEDIQSPARYPTLGGSQATVQPQALQIAGTDQLAAGLVVPGPAVDDDFGVVGVACDEPINGGVHRSDPVGHCCHDAYSDPGSAEAAEAKGCHAEVEEVLLIGRHDHGYGRVGQGQVGVVGQGRRLGGRVVSDEQHGSARRARAHGVGVLEHVAAAIEAGTFAIPGANDTIEALVGDGGAHLRTPHGRGGQLLVEPRAVVDAVGGQLVPQAAYGQVGGTQRRTRVPGHEGGRIQAHPQVQSPPGYQQVGDGVDPGEQAAGPMLPRCGAGVVSRADRHVLPPVPAWPRRVLLPQLQKKGWRVAGKE